METASCICKMRRLCSAITELENSLNELFGLSLNEAMVMCCIGQGKSAAGEIAGHTGIKVSHLSKVLRSIEDKRLITREFGEKDKRMIFFSLTDEGITKLNTLNCKALPVPELLKNFLEE